MQVFWDLNHIYPKKDCIVSVGTYDGIHLGHQKIVNELIEKSKQKQLVSTLVTFEPHPQLILKRADKPEIKLLTTIEEKIDVLEALGLDRLVIASFSSAFSNISPDIFVESILVQKLGMKHIIIGYDHSFGKRRAGNIELLRNLGKVHNFDVDVTKQIQLKNETVSSTLVRRLLLEGNVKQANIFLGRLYSLRGQVIPGHGRGREFGFPTANIKTYSQYKLVPKSGIYATRLKLNETLYNSVTYIGNRPTLGLKENVIETHIFDFDQELYNSEIDLEFVDFIRDDETFQTTDELVHQIKADKKKSMELLTIFSS